VRLGRRPVSAVTEQDLEAFIRHLGALGRTAATRNHYVRILRVMDRWLGRKGYRPAPLLSGESDVIRKRKATKRSRRLAQDEETRLLATAGPHLQRVIICALEIGSRIGEILSLQRRDMSFEAPGDSAPH
jgi:integrase